MLRRNVVIYSVMNKTSGVFNPTDVICTNEGLIFVCDINNYIHILDINGNLVTTCTYKENKYITFENKTNLFDL
jgi:hypothetical protein